MRLASARVIVFGGLVCAMTAVACGATTPAGSTPNITTDAGSSAQGGEDAGDASAKDSVPFAGSTAEATALISAVVNERHTDIVGCVRDFRIRRKMGHNRVLVSFGIDQDGKLLGVTSKGKEDAELKSCMRDALKGAPFPRSHAGVITVTKTYEDIVVQ